VFLNNHFNTFEDTMAGFYAPCVDETTGVYKYFHAGSWTTSSSGKAVKILNPSTNDAAYQVQGR
jgi:hypothetical protein